VHYNTYRVIITIVKVIMGCNDDPFMYVSAYLLVYLLANLLAYLFFCGSEDDASLQ